jgi:hypothetical protein
MAGKKRATPQKQAARLVQLWFDSAEPGPYEARKEMDIKRIVAV